MKDEHIKVWNKQYSLIENERLGGGGNAKVYKVKNQNISDCGYGYTYPVSYESWDAGNCYVGKYSNLSTLDEDYIAALDAWLMYLIKGEHIRTDYVPDDVDENDLIEKIKKYY